MMSMSRKKEEGRSSTRTTSCVSLILLLLLLPFSFLSDGHGFVRGCDDSSCGRERGVLLVSELS